MAASREETGALTASWLLLLLLLIIIVIINLREEASALTATFSWQRFSSAATELAAVSYDEERGGSTSSLATSSGRAPI